MIRRNRALLPMGAAYKTAYRHRRLRVVQRCVQIALALGVLLTLGLTILAVRQGQAAEQAGTLPYRRYLLGLSVLELLLLAVLGGMRRIEK